MAPGTVKREGQFSTVTPSTGVTTSRVGGEEKTEVRVVSGETNLILHIETYQL